MSIGQGWKEERYRRLRGYLFRRFRRVSDPHPGMYGPLSCAAYDRYVQLLMALDKRQEEETC